METSNLSSFFFCEVPLNEVTKWAHMLHSGEVVSIVFGTTVIHLVSAMMFYK